MDKTIYTLVVTRKSARSEEEVARLSAAEKRNRDFGYSPTSIDLPYDEAEVIRIEVTLDQYRAIADAALEQSKRAV